MLTFLHLLWSISYLQYKFPLPEIMSNKDPNSFSIEDKKKHTRILLKQKLSKVFAKEMDTDKFLQVLLTSHFYSYKLSYNTSCTICTNKDVTVNVLFYTLPFNDRRCSYCYKVIAGINGNTLMAHHYFFCHKTVHFLPSFQAHIFGSLDFQVSWVVT